MSPRCTTKAVITKIASICLYCLYYEEKICASHMCINVQHICYTYFQAQFFHPPYIQQQVDVFSETVLINSMYSTFPAP